MSELLPYIMDAAVIFIVVLYLSKGWRKGLAQMVVSALSFVLALILAWQLYGYVADFLRTIGLQAKLAASLGSRIDAPANPGVAEAAGFIQSLFLPDALKDNMIGNNNYEAYSALGVSSFGEYIGVFLAHMVINALALLLVFLVSFIALRVISHSLGVINHIPLLGSANRLLGLAAGGIIGYCTVEIWMFVFTMMATGQNVFSTMVMAIEKSTVAAWFYHSNHLVDWIMQILA